MPRFTRLASWLLVCSLSFTVFGCGGHGADQGLERETNPENLQASRDISGNPTANLVQDPEFASGVSGFFAQDATSSVIRSTSSPISGTASLGLSINGWGNNIWWQKPVTGTANEKLSALTVSLKARANTSSASKLQICAAAYYATGTLVKQCSAANPSVGVVSPVQAVLTLNPLLALAQVDIQINQEGSSPVNYTIDSVSVVGTLPPPPSTPVLSGCTTASATATQWQNAGFAAQSGTFTLEADVTPSLAGLDAGVGVAKATTGGWSGLAGILLFNTSGTLSVRNGSSYVASAVPYSAGVAYHVRMVVNVPSHTYSVYVTPQGGAEKTIGTSMAFRTEQATITSISDFAIVADASGSLQACNVTLASAPVVIPSPSPTPSPTPTPTPSPTPSPTPTPTPTPSPTPSASASSSPSQANPTPVPISTTIPPTVSGHPRIFLDSTFLGRLRARALAGDSAWVALKSYCDQVSTGTIYPPSGDNYPNFPSIGTGYQGEDYVPAIRGLGLCYQVAQATDAASASKYGAQGVKLLKALATPPDGSAGLSASTDSGYGIRNYGLGMAIGYDWLYPLLDAGTKSQVISSFNAWISWFDSSGFLHNVASGNYFEGYFAAKAIGALAMDGDNASAPAQWSDVQARMWNQLTVPTLNNGLYGGGWGEGFQYGPLSIRNIGEVLWAAKTAKGLDWIHQTSFARDEAAYLTSFTWPSLLHMDDGGGIVRSQPQLYTSIGALSFLSTLLKYAGDSYAPYAASFAADLVTTTAPKKDDRQPWAKFMHSDPANAQTDYRTQSLSYFAPGPGHVAVRSSWDKTAVLGVLQSGPVTEAPDSGEQMFNQGAFEIVKGDFPIVASATGWMPQGDCASCEELIYSNNYGSPHPRDLYNVFFVNDSANSSNPGQFANTSAATHVDKFEDNGVSYAHARGVRLEDMYNGRPIDRWTRDMVYVRPDVFVIYDRTSVAARNAGSDQWLNFHFAVDPAPVSANDASQRRFDLTRGSLIGSLRTLLPANPVVNEVALPGGRIWKIEEHAPTRQKDLEWLTVVTTQASVPDQVRLTSGDGNVTASSGSMTGALVKTTRNAVVLFNNDPAATGSTSTVTYRVAQSAIADHVLIDMAPGKYDVSATTSGGTITVNVKPGSAIQVSAQGVLSFSVGLDGVVSHP